MNAPVIIWLVSASFALPVLGGLWRWRACDRPMKFVMAWYAVLVLEGALAVAWARFVDRSNNLVVAQVFMPVEATLVLSALAEWQVRPLLRTTIRATIPLFWIVWTCAFFFAEGIGHYSTVSGPLLGLLVLAGALTAFITRVHHDQLPILHSVWGWVLPGLAIFFGINATATILLSVALAAHNWNLMVNATLLRAWIYLFATLLITVGFIWPTRSRSSGSSLSLPLSR